MGIIAPIAIVIGIVALICIFYKFNFVSDDMENFIKSGGGKRDERGSRRFVRDRKFYGNTIIIACIAALVCAYCAFCGPILFLMLITARLRVHLAKAAGADFIF